MTDEHEVVEAGRVDVGADGRGAVREGHRVEGRGMDAAAGQVHRQHRAVEVRHQPVPASAVETTPVDEDDGSHARPSSSIIGVRPQI